MSSPVMLKWLPPPVSVLKCVLSAVRYIIVGMYMYYKKKSLICSNLIYEPTNAVSIFLNNIF